VVDAAAAVAFETVVVVDAADAAVAVGGKWNL